jgi:F-type H+-transporting ATPase subunit b
MQIDWITVAAQIVNFLVLAWLLHRFLYGPITRAMERREQRIAQRLNEAAQRREEAENEVRSYQERRKELDDQQEQFLVDARHAAERERNRLLEESRADIEQQKQRWRTDLDQQREELLSDVRQRARDHFYALARRALGDLADVDLEEQMCQVFRKKLAALDDEAKGRLAAAGRQNNNDAVVRSGFALSSGARQEISRTIHEAILPGATVAFERYPDVICGIELKMGGQTVAWSLDSYFEALEQLTDEALGAHSPSTE